MWTEWFADFPRPKAGCTNAIPAKQLQGKQITESSGWVFISDNTSHSNNHVNHYLQQIHEHYDAYYVQNDFGHIAVLTVWADNCSEQFKSRYQLGWSVLYVNKTTLQVIHLFFFCPQHGKGPPTTPSRCYWCVFVAAVQLHCCSFTRDWAVFHTHTYIQICAHWTGPTTPHYWVGAFPNSHRKCSANYSRADRGRYWAFVRFLQAF